MLHLNVCRNNAKLIVNLVRNMSATATDKTVLTEEVGDKGIIILNRPKALNAINLDMVRKIVATLRQWESQKSMVITKGSTSRAYCCGGDIREIHAHMENFTDCCPKMFTTFYPMSRFISAYKIPYVAIIDGITMGGGVGLSIHGHYRIATERTVFAMPECAIGLFPDVGASYFLSRMTGKLGLFLGLTGARLQGKDVLKVGVATHYTKSDNLPALEAALLSIDNSNQIETVLNKFCDANTPDFSLNKHIDQINYCFSAATVEEIVENLQKDGSDWAKHSLKLMNNMSPTSLKVTKLQLERGGQMKNLRDCLKMEFRIVQRAVNADFKEGIRALLIDKDLSPQWNPKTLEDVSDEYVESFFKPLEKELKFEY